MDAVLNDTEPLREASFCIQHARLEARYHFALEAWARLREEAWQRDLRGRELNGELMRLQGEFAASYTQLHKHTRECVLCRFGMNLAAPETSASLDVAVPHAKPN
jgi:hypothetical protein